MNSVYARFSIGVILIFILLAIYSGCQEEEEATVEPTPGQNAVAIIPGASQAFQTVPSSPAEVGSPSPLPTPVSTAGSPQPGITPGSAGTEPKPKPTPGTVGARPKPKPTPGTVGTKPRPKPSLAAATPVPKPTPRYVTRPVPKPVPTPTDIRQAITVTVKEQASCAGARNIDLVLCIDVSGSMQPLIDMAKQKLWDIARDIRGLKEKPSLRIALISYGSDRYAPESGWVRIETDFTDNLNLVHGKLAILKASGENEFIGRALKVSVDDLSWSSEPDTLRTIFVAGNEQVNQDPSVQVPEVCDRAKKKGIIINSIFCELMFDTFSNEWQELARLGEGRYSIVKFTEKMFGKQSPTPFSTKMPTEKAGFTSFQGQIVGILNDSDLMVKDSSLGGGTKTFKVDNRTKYTPGAWRPSSGDLVILYYDPAHPSRIREIENAQ